MSEIKILWADDEIDLLKPQLLFLEKKGYEVITVTNGYDALEEYEQNNDIDIVFLDESMPGLTGLETLEKFKAINPHLPIVMITKNEAENIMEEAIGSQIADYLIKPVNPNQILLSLKKIVDNKRLVREKTSTGYQQEFRQILMDINSGLDYKEWAEIYKKIIHWEIKIDKSDTTDMMDILSMQKREANSEFSKFIIRNYPDWIGEDDEGPTLSHQLMKRKIFSELTDVPTVFLLLDNLRFDQWKMLEPIINEYYKVVEEDFFYSILPTSTQYSRNAIFSGLTPLEISNYYPNWWRNDNEEGGKNMFEKELLGEHIKRHFRKEIKHDYVKVTKLSHAKQVQDNIMDLLNNDLVSDCL